MTPIQIGVLAVRLAAIVLAVLCMGQHDVVLATLRWINANMQEVRPGLWIAFLPPLIQLATAALLWMHAGKVARWLIPDLKATISDQVQSDNFLRWQTVGVFCLGLWVLTRGIADAVYWLAYYLPLRASDSGFSGLDVASRAAVITTAIELIMGLWLLLGAQGFAKLLYKVRTARLEQKS
jgi:hypothetical protein